MPASPVFAPHFLRGRNGRFPAGRGQFPAGRGPRRSSGPAALLALGVLLFFPASPSPAQSAAPDPVATNAWMKILGLMGGGLGASGAAGEPVHLSEAEVEAMLGGQPIAPLLREQGGLSEVRVRFSPGEVRLSASADPASLAEVLRLPGLPLTIPPTATAGGPVPVETTLRLQGDAGYGTASLVGASVGGRALPPEMVEDAVLEWLLTSLAVEGSASRFPLPAGVRALEVEDGRIRLIPASPPGD